MGLFHGLLWGRRPEPQMPPTDSPVDDRTLGPTLPRGRDTEEMQTLQDRLPRWPPLCDTGSPASSV